MPNKKAPAKPAGRGAPWYADGLRFECLPGCGACCTDHGAYTALYLTDCDVRRLADYLDLSRAEFERAHTTREDGYLLLKMEQPDCPFLEKGRCNVYDARPTQCSTFPFWKENLKSRTAWARLCEFCPGIDAGELHDRRVINEHLERRRPAS